MNGQVLKRLWRYARPARAAFLLSSLFVSCRYFVINYLTAYLTGRVAEAALHWDPAGLLRDTGRFILLLIPFLLVDAAAKYVHAMSTQRIGNDLRSRAYHRILHAPLWQVEQLGAGRGQVLARLNGDMGVVENLYRSSLLAPLIFGGAGVGAFVSIWLVRPTIAIFLLLLGLSSFALQSGMSRQKKRVSGRIQALLAALLTTAGECLTCGPAIRLMHAQRGVLGHAQRRLAQYLDAGARDAAIQGGAEMVSGGAAMLQYVGVMLLSILALEKGEMAPAQVVYILQLSGLIVSAFTLVGSTLITLRGYLPALGRVEEILSLSQEDLQTGLNAAEACTHAEVCASQAVLCFSPEKKLPIRRDLLLKAGQMTALCGASGCGKTSFVKTLLGFYPYEGSITLAGKPLQAFSKASLRAQIAYLPQQSLLIAGTLRDNLLVGCRAPVERAQLEAALRICTCDEWLADLPDGLDTRLQEGGLRLSGGQRQMLVLARALLQEKPMIIMDETFSAIDKQRAVQIMANIRRAHPGKTILLISHEEEIVNRCDGRVYLLPQAG